MTNMISRDNTNGSRMSRPDLPLGTWVDGVLNSTLNRFFDDGFLVLDSPGKKNTVPVNITESEKAYHLELFTPGLKKEDFSVNVNSRMLTVSYQQQESADENRRGNYLRKEFMVQSFSRTFSLDETVDEANISGHYTDGILHLQIPKKEGASLTKNIEIK